MEFIPLLLIALLFWFLVIRPQRRRTRQQAEVWNSLAPGQDVFTAGGLIGRVQRVDEREVLLEIAENTVVRVDKRAVHGRLEEPARSAGPG